MDLELTTLPLDAPDDDARWAGFQRQLRIGFLEDAGNADILRWFRHCARADGMRLRGLVDRDDLLADSPVATYGSVPNRLNVGGGALVDANMVTDVTVRATHRRQGLLRRLMEADLREAKERGDVLAALTASEGAIYGRFGFGVATRLAEGWIDCRKFKLRADPGGSFAYVAPADAREHYDMIAAENTTRHRGSFDRFAFHPAFQLGEFDWNTAAPNARTTCVVHRDDDGVVDGLAIFEPVADSRPGEVKVVEVMATDDAASLALWGFLASLDLVEKLSCGRLRVDDPLQWALVDPRALKFTTVYDHLWLRVLNTPRALAERGWDADGDLVLRVSDDMGLADGTWRLRVADGVADVKASRAKPTATVDAETLASLYLGGVSSASLAAAGRIDGDADAVARLFAVTTPPYTPVGF